MTIQTSDRAALARAALHRTRLFADWPEEVLDALCAAGIMQRYRKGQSVVRQGDPPSGLWLITEGSLVNSRALHSGRRIVFEHLLPGQITGVLPVLDGLPAVFDVTVKDRAAALFIPRDAFIAVIRDDPRLLMRIVEFLCRRTRLDYENIQMKVVNSTRVQLVKIILYLARGPGLPGPEFEVPVGVSQDDVADMMGVTRQTVNKEMMPLLRAGILAWRYRRIYILDAKRLFDIAEAEGRLPPEMNDVIFHKPKGAFRATD